MPSSSHVLVLVLALAGVGIAQAQDARGDSGGELNETQITVEAAEPAPEPQGVPAASAPATRRDESADSGSAVYYPFSQPSNPAPSNAALAPNGMDDTSWSVGQIVFVLLLAALGLAALSRVLLRATD